MESYIIYLNKKLYTQKIIHINYLYKYIQIQKICIKKLKTRNTYE
jgi:hypothetical protein